MFQPDSPARVANGSVVTAETRIFFGYGHLVGAGDQGDRIFSIEGVDPFEMADGAGAFAIGLGSNLLADNDWRPGNDLPCGHHGQ
jgi:hypothetical protein